MTLNKLSDNIIRINQIVEAEGVCRKLFQRAAPSAERAVKAGGLLPLPRAPEIRWDVSAALRLPRADLKIGITGGTVEYIMLHPVLLQDGAFYFVKYQERMI